MVLTFANLNEQIVLHKNFGRSQLGDKAIQLDFSGLKNGIYFGLLLSGDKKEISRKLKFAH